MLPNYLLQLVGHRGTAVNIGTWEEDNKLLASNPEYAVLFPQLITQQGNQINQNPVAGLMAEAVVDLLEMIEVNRDYDSIAAVTITLPQDLIKHSAQHAAISGLGQRIA